MKVFIVSSLQPFGHYTQILTNALVRNPYLKVFIAAEKAPENETVEDCGAVYPIWNKGPFFFLPILKKIHEVNPDMIHLQHEFMMYGGSTSAFMFPFFVLFLKIMGYPVIVTIHAVLDLDNVNDDFISAFHLRSALAKPFFLKRFFTVIIWLISIFADTVLCHTKTAASQLTKQYHVSKKKIHIIPACIPEKKVYNSNPKNYFLYFGYITPRKGLEHIIKAFVTFHQKDPSFRLILAGGTIPGQEKYVEELRRIIKPYQYIEFRGEMKDESKLDELYKKAYAVVNPAIINVGSSGPLYQARGYHSCILASDIDHLKEDITDHENGLLVKNTHWADAFRQISHNSKLRNKLIANTIRLAEERNPENTAKNYLQLYSSFE